VGANRTGIAHTCSSATIAAVCLSCAAGRDRPSKARPVSVVLRHRSRQTPAGSHR
jgi:mevalonate pyrophosphate decarboxylase